jgi:hypothetical protein
MRETKNARCAIGVLLGSLWISACSDDASSTGPSTAGSGGSVGGSGSGAGATGGGGGTVEPCALGSTWTVVDDFVYSPGEPSNVGAIAAGPAGELYVSGVVRQGMFRALLRKSVDGGATWTTLEGVDPDSMQPVGGSGLVVDPAGVLFTVGVQGGQRVVWRSDDGGETFSRLDDAITIPTTIPCNTGAIAREADGTLYTVASCDDTGWLVRRGEDSGATWSTASTFQLATGKPARSGEVFVDAMGRPFTAGQAHDALDVNHWVVRGPDAQGNWATLDDYQLGQDAHAAAASLGGRTRLFAVGAAATALPDFTGSHWIVRSQDPTTRAWSTADDFAPSMTATSWAMAIYEDPAGALLVAGYVDETGTGANSAVARRSDDGGASWRVVDTYSYQAGKPTAATHLASDPAGNVYMTVRGVDATDNPHWIVRKLACD